MKTGFIAHTLQRKSHQERCADQREGESRIPDRRNWEAELLGDSITDRYPREFILVEHRIVESFYNSIKMVGKDY